MALVRILIDGYSLLHSWPTLAPGKARHSAAAREELIRKLTLYQDSGSVPITVFFDGSGPKQRPGKPGGHSVEVLYSSQGKTADDLIERAAHLYAAYGEVLVVTDDHAERETVMSVGGMASSCWNFVQTIESTLAEQADDLKDHNRRERHRFQQRRK